MKFLHLDEVSMLLGELENTTSMNSKQAVLFDIYNAVFDHQVRQMNFAFEKKKATQIHASAIQHPQQTMLSQERVRTENRSTSNKPYKQLSVCILFLFGVALDN
ncbi:hypothetical protein [Vibrio algivorus]|uniref:hypothetical protein n=1 Tax=Vibrio algivorus TaxID=1667024 RepID=UPI0011AE74EC|nr:hypothetical protein [Vibrio algivorus]